MEAVANGKTDCTFLNYYQASNYRASGAYDSFAYQPDERLTQSISLGVTRDSNPALFGILCKSLQHLTSSGTLQSILNKDAIQEQPLTFSYLLKRYPVQTICALVVLCGILAGLVSLSIVSSERKRKNIQLAEAKKQADAANAAKSEFLSRMSHVLLAVRFYVQVIIVQLVIEKGVDKAVRTIAGYFLVVSVFADRKPPRVLDDLGEEEEQSHALCHCARLHQYGYGNTVWGYARLR